MVQSQLYNQDPRDIAVYCPRQAAHYIDIHPATLKTWFSGRNYPTQTGTAHFQAVLEPAGQEPTMLSFNNLVEALVLKLLRKRHKVPMKTIREALEVAGNELSIERPLLRNTLHVSFGELFVEHFGRMKHLRADQQLALKEYFAAHAQRVDMDSDLHPIRYYPTVSIWQELNAKTSKPIVIDPYVGFGKPTVANAGVSTDVIVERINAGETVDNLAYDYTIPTSHIKAAVAFHGT